MEQCFIGDRVLLDNGYLGPATVHVNKEGVITKVVRSRDHPPTGAQVSRDREEGRGRGGIACLTGDTSDVGTSGGSEGRIIIHCCCWRFQQGGYKVFGTDYHRA